MVLYDFSFRQLNGEEFPLEKIKGKRVLLFNTASACGYTPQLGVLSEMYAGINPAEATIVGVPCNDFGAQEPGTAEEIGAFCSINYGVTFPLTEKMTIAGEAAHPLFRWLQAEANDMVKWNFHKFLIDEAGKVVGSFSTATSPADSEITDWLYGKQD